MTKLNMALSALTLVLVASAANAVPMIDNTGVALQPAELAIVVNDKDPNSVAIGEAYRVAHRMSVANVLHVSFTPGAVNMAPADFKVMKQTLDALTPATIQAYLLTWNAPYAVGKMSITSAFAFGYDPKWTTSTICMSTASSPYFDSDVAKPKDLGMRLAMTLGASTPTEATAIATRGMNAAMTFAPVSGTPAVAATLPHAYLLSTTDSNRNVRKSDFGPATTAAFSFVQSEVVYANYLTNKSDIMFQFTGVVTDTNLMNNKYLPGAMADHLTSYGGKLTDSTQMSALQWIKAGATGTYGTVTEPCNYTQKFPKPSVAMARYMRGETLIQAYWKSVAWPGEGIFVGDPLAQPFAYIGSRVRVDPKLGALAEFPGMKKGNYQVEVAAPGTTTWKPLGVVSVTGSGPVSIILGKSVEPTSMVKIRVKPFIGTILITTPKLGLWTYPLTWNYITKTP